MAAAVEDQLVHGARVQLGDLAQERSAVHLGKAPGRAGIKAEQAMTRMMDSVFPSPRTACA